MVDYGDSDKIMKINVKTERLVVIFHSLFKNFFRLNIFLSFSTFKQLKKLIKM